MLLTTMPSTEIVTPFESSDWLEQILPTSCGDILSAQVQGVRVKDELHDDGLVCYDQDEDEDEYDDGSSPSPNSHKRKRSSPKSKKSPKSNESGDEEITDDQENKRLKRLARNRLSAQKSRLKKKQKLDELEQNMLMLERQNAVLLEKVRLLEAENSSLRACTCCDQCNAVTMPPHQMTTLAVDGSAFSPDYRSSSLSLDELSAQSSYPTSPIGDTQENSIVVDVQSVLVD